MEHELKDIRALRKKLSMTQSQLAKISGVSQSMIAKIESGNLDPAHSNVLKIFNALDSAAAPGLKAADFFNKKVVYVSPEDSLQTAMKKILSYSISQIPVIDKDKLVGRVSESRIIRAFLENKKSLKVKQIMQEHPPIVPKSASVRVVARMLKTYPIVIVIEKGKIIGVITKSDVLRVIYKKKLLG